MKKLYSTIGLIGKPDHNGAKNTIETLLQHLVEQGYKVLVEESISSYVNSNNDNIQIQKITQIGEKANLAIVVGGDGYMLGAARVLACYDIDVIGVNRGSLGFLTDLPRDNLIAPLEAILRGESKH